MKVASKKKFLQNFGKYLENIEGIITAFNESGTSAEEGAGDAEPIGTIPDFFFIPQDAYNYKWDKGCLNLANSIKRNFERRDIQKAVSDYSNCFQEGRSLIESLTYLNEYLENHCKKVIWQ